MNNLSWIIYIADFVGKIQVMSLIASAILLFAMGFGSFIIFVEREAKDVRRFLFVTIPALIFLSFLATATPSRSTIYMIAASEFGEKVVTSPESQEVFNELKSIIKKRLREELNHGHE